MPDHIEAIQRRLEGMIAEAESRMSGSGSILSYGMKIRRDTAEEILRFIKSLARTAATDAPVREHRLRSADSDPPRFSDIHAPIADAEWQGLEYVMDGDQQHPQASVHRASSKHTRRPKMAGDASSAFVQLSGFRSNVVSVCPTRQISNVRSSVKDEDGGIVEASKIATDITQQKRDREQIAVLAREAEHRSKNLLASVRAILHLSRADSVDDLKQALEGRFRALENVNSLLVESRWIGADLSTIASQELAPYAPSDKTRVQIAGPSISLAANAAQPLTIILHELTTNAAKYGCLSQAAGRLELTWHRENGRLTIIWREVGGPVVQEPNHRGFGSRVIEQMVGQLRGAVKFDWRSEGLVCEIVVQIYPNGSVPSMQLPTSARPGQDPTSIAHVE